MTAEALDQQQLQRPEGDEQDAKPDPLTLRRRPPLLACIYPAELQGNTNRVTGTATPRRGGHTPAFSIASPRFPAPGLLRGLRPTRVPSAGSEPAPVLGQAGPGTGATPDGSHVHHAPIKGPDAQLLPRQHRHDYAADLHHGLPAGAIHWLRSRPPHTGRQPRTAPRPLSARFEPAHRLRDFWAIELLVTRHDESAGREHLDSMHADAPAFLWSSRNSRFIGPAAGLGEER
jgi:hypothetical protein